MSRLCLKHEVEKRDAVMEEMVRGGIILQGVDVEFQSTQPQLLRLWQLNSVAFHSECSLPKPKSIIQGV